MATYVVDPLHLCKALLMVLTGPHPATNAVFVHGSPAADDEIDTDLLRLAVDMVAKKEAGSLVINGLTDAECWPGGKRLAYPGSDTWGRTLQQIGFSGQLMIPSSKHTAAESDNLISLAKEKGWESITIMSYPHHILRCMLQMVFCLARAKSDLKVYTRTLPSINWQKVAEKGVLNNEPFRGTLIEAHVREEYERLIKYADKEGTGYTPHATLNELLVYCQWRDES